MVQIYKEHDQPLLMDNSTIITQNTGLSKLCRSRSDTKECSTDQALHCLPVILQLVLADISTGTNVAKWTCSNIKTYTVRGKGVQIFRINKHISKVINGHINADTKSIF